jgi:hypothetical protein
MERTGAIVDKAKYKRLVAGLHREEKQRRRDDGERYGDRARNVHLERFKFWLGMPNKYFEGGEWDWHDRDESRY